MHVNRKGNEVTVAFDTEDEAKGLYAYLTGTVHEVPQAMAEKGQWLYSWFFAAIQKLAFNFDIEKNIKTQSPETQQATPTAVVSSPKKTRKR